LDQTARYHTRLRVAGLSCAADAAGLERRLRQVDGVDEVAVNPLMEVAYVTYDPDRLDALALIAEIERAGYRAV
jgi:Cu+-exporting ATPase